jgi:hypothetical protein
LDSEVAFFTLLFAALCVRVGSFSSSASVPIYSLDL